MTTPSSQEAVNDAFTLHEFVSAIQRLFKIGIYYPSGHQILDKATQRFMVQLGKVAGDKKAVELRVTNDTLLLEEIELDGENPAVKDFSILLSTLGISVLSIDRHISMKELHEFVRKMLFYKAKMVNAKQFTQVEVSDLPYSVTIEQKEFTARGGQPISEDVAEEAANDLNAFVASLNSYGLNEGEIDQCRSLLEKLPEQLSNTNIDLGDLPTASWNDVAGLLARVVRGKTKGGGKGGPFASQANINALSSILKKLERETLDKKSREAINLLVSVIRRPPPDQEIGDGQKEELSLTTFPEKPAISAAKIQEFTTNQKLDTKICAKIPKSSTQNETFSILIQIVINEQPLNAQIRMQQLIREALSSALSEKSWHILSNGLHMIVQSGNMARLMATIRLFTETMRSSAQGNTLRLFDLTVKLCSPEEKKILWPHIVNELLVVGSSKDKIAFHQLSQVAARHSYDEMIAALPQLQALESFADNKVASDIFHAVSPSCYPLFAFLLKTELERYIGERVLGGLRRNPRDWLIKAIAPILDLNIQEHKLFLYSYLRQAPQSKNVSVALKKIAAKIISDALAAMSQERRTEQWVETTIGALAELPGERTMQVLQQIAGGKKMLFIPDWPAACRHAAQNALQVVKGKY
ncbi:MAG: hypothetical protein QNJ17_12625 [Desulfocapsaceae bacterium]|nr:hypothetical protein [Desulfocapsaceae bacterium]